MTQNNKSNSEPNEGIVSLLQTIAKNTAKEDTPFKDFTDSANQFKDAVAGFRDFARSFFSTQQKQAFDNVHLDNLAVSLNLDRSKLYGAQEVAVANGGSKEETNSLFSHVQEMADSDPAKFKELERMLGENVHLTDEKGNVSSDLLQILQDNLKDKDPLKQRALFDLLGIGLSDGLRKALSDKEKNVSTEQGKFAKNAPNNEILQKSRETLGIMTHANSAADKVRQEEFDRVAGSIQALDEAFIKLEATHPDLLASGVVALSLALMGLNAATVASTGITLFSKGKRFKAFLRSKKGAGLAGEALEEGEELFEGKEKTPASEKTSSKAKKADAKPTKAETEPKGETKTSKAPAEATKNAPKAPHASANMASKTAQAAEKAEEGLKTAEKTGENLVKKAAATGIKKRGAWGLLRMLGNIPKSPAARGFLWNAAKTGGSAIGEGIALDGLLTLAEGAAGAGTAAEIGLGALLAPEIALPLAAGAAGYGVWQWWSNRQAEHEKQQAEARKAAETRLNTPPPLPGMQASPQNITEFCRQAENGQNEKAQIAAQKNAFFQKSMLLEKERALGPLTEIRTGDIIVNEAHTNDPHAFAYEVEQVITDALNRTSRLFNPNIAI